jgi:DNA-binding transcriptional MerR regulator
MLQLSIGDVAKLTGVAVSAIRYYEEQGLLPRADRRANNRRCYGDETVQAIEFIAACRKASMTLEAIRKLQDQLQQPGLRCEQAADIVGDAISDITLQIVELQKARKHLSKVATACSPTLCDGGSCTVPDTMRAAW